MIYLVRHGLDDERFVGGYSDVGLIDLGIIQIEEVGEWLLSQKFYIKSIYSSDITRALESASIINKYLNLCIYIDGRLREQNKGLLNGMARDIAEKDYFKYLNTNDVNKRFPNGESLMDLYLRVKDLLLNINLYDDCLLVTHRGIINMIYYFLNNDVLDMNKGKYNVCHGSVHELDLNKCKIRRIK